MFRNASKQIELARNAFTSGPAIHFSFDTPSSVHYEQASAATSGPKVIMICPEVYNTHHLKQPCERWLAFGLAMYLCKGHVHSGLEKINIHLGPPSTNTARCEEGQFMHVDFISKSNKYLISFTKCLSRAWILKTHVFPLHPLPPPPLPPTRPANLATRIPSLPKLNSKSCGQYYWT